MLLWFAVAITSVISTTPPPPAPAPPNTHPADEKLS